MRKNLEMGSGTFKLITGIPFIYILIGDKNPNIVFPKSKCNHSCTVYDFYSLYSVMWHTFFQIEFDLQMPFKSLLHTR